MRNLTDTCVYLKKKNDISAFSLSGEFVTIRKFDKWSLRLFRPPLAQRNFKKSVHSYNLIKYPVILYLTLS